MEEQKSVRIQSKILKIVGALGSSWGCKHERRQRVLSPDFKKTSDKGLPYPIYDRKEAQKMVKPIKPVDKDDTSKRKDRREAFDKFSKKNSELDGLPIAAPAMLPDAAKKVWAELVPELNKAGFARSLDIYLVIGFCTQYAIYQDALENVDDLGIIIETARGATKNPAVNVANDSLQKTLSIARQIGLTPSSRAELYAAAPDEPDDDKSIKLASMFNF